MRAAFVCALILFCAFFCRVARAATPSVALDQGRIAYERGDYGSAVEIIRPLVYPSIELADEEAVIEAHRLLALSYFFQKKDAQAEEEVAELLALKPSFQLDPIVDPPIAVRFFQGIRQKQEERLREIQARQQEDAIRAAREEERRRAAALAKAERVYIDRQVERHSRLLGFIPFGVGQIQNGNRKLGVFFAVSEFVFGAVSLSMFVAIDQNYPGGQVPASRLNTAETLSTIQIVSGAAFWATALAGIIDAQVRYRPFVVVEQKPAPHAQLQPILSPTFYGLGVRGAF